MKKTTTNHSAVNAKKDNLAIPVKDEKNQKDTRSESAEKKDASQHKKKTKTSAIKKETGTDKQRLIVISLLFFISLAASALAAYDFWLLRTQASVNAHLTNAQSNDETRITQLEQQTQSVKEKLVTETQARLSAQSERAAINSALQGISERLGRSTLAWRMAEVEYLLTIANHRLTLAQDRQTAIRIFETADSRLKAIADPSLLKVRKLIASELSALRAVPTIDIPGIAVQIGSLAEDVKQLPLLDKKRLATATEKKHRVSALDWRELPSAVWEDIKSLVQVRRHQQATEPLLPPNQAWFLYQNLQLKLEQARLAALQKNTALFAQSIDEVSQWLNNYFEVGSPLVANTLAALNKLRNIELQPPVPDVSGSLRELRSVMNARSMETTSPTSKVSKQ